jgi:branched-chain amino acid transport system substrate-binding protein
MTGATKWEDPAHYHWTMGFLPSYQLEARIYAHYILKTMPKAKIGVLYQDDDYGKDYLKGFLDGLGPEAKTMIVKEASYETTDPTVDSQIIALKASGANVFFNVTIPSFAVKAIKKAYDIGWHPTQFLNNVSNEFPVMKAAGLKQTVGLISTLFVKDPTDPEWHNDADYKAWLAWMNKYQPHADKANVFNVWGYVDAEVMAQTLKQCGNDLTRANLMRQAANLKNLRPAMMMPGTVINTGPTQYAVIRQLTLAKFNGKIWVPFSKALSD